MSGPLRHNTAESFHCLLPRPGLRRRATVSCLLAVLLLLLSGGVSRTWAQMEWTPIQETETRIQFTLTGLPQAQHFKRTVSGADQFFALWGSDGAEPHAGVFLQMLWPEREYEDEIVLETFLQNWNFLSGKSVTGMESDSLRNEHGSVEVRRFRADNYHCVGFGQHLGLHSLGFEGDLGIRPNYIGGYYCDLKAVSNDTLRSVVRAVGTK